MNQLMYIREGKELNIAEKIRLTISLSIPSIIAQITSIIMQYIDASMVGHMGANEAASIGIVASSTWLFGSVCHAAVAGFSIQVAQAFGAKDYKHGRDLTWQGYFGAIGFALILAVIGATLSFKLPYLLGGEEVIARDATLYFLIYSCGLPIMALKNHGGYMMQVSGNMKIPGMLNSLLCILDVILNFFFIFPSKTYHLGQMSVSVPGLGLGVAGAALGTVGAYAIVAVLMQICMYRNVPELNLVKHRKTDGNYRFIKTDLIRAVKLAVPIAAEEGIICGALVVTTGIIAPLGVTAIAANSFAVTAESLCYMPGFGIEDAALTLVGQSVGAKRRPLAKSFGKISIAMGMLIMAGAGVLLYIFAPQMMRLLTPDAGVIALGVTILHIEAFAEPFYGASIVCAGVLRGDGDTLSPSIMNFLSLWLVRIPLSLLLVRSYGLVGVWIAMCSELTFRGIIFLIRFKFKKW